MKFYVFVFLSAVLMLIAACDDIAVPYQRYDQKVYEVARFVNGILF